LSIVLVLGSSRGIFLVTVGVATLVTALRVGRGRLALLLAVIGLVSVGVAIAVAAPLAASSSNPLIAHQAAGLANPTDPASSTLLLHLNLMKGGLISGLHHPLGTGTGSTTIAAQKLTGASASVDGTQGSGTETDVTNSLVAFGILGPILLFAIAYFAFRRAFARYAADRSAAALAAVGILLATFGGWLNGQAYAVAPLTLFVMGWAARPAPRRSIAPATPPATGRAARSAA
jgi:hypothetical protein